MMDINVRGTFLLTKAALPHLRKSPNAHVVTLAPPLNLSPHWLGAHPSYTLSKYGMTLLSLGWAAEYAEAGIGFSCLWPQTYIATSAVTNLADGDALVSVSRSPDIMADAAVAILTSSAAEANGQCFIDADLLAAAGVTDLSGVRRRRPPQVGHLRRRAGGRAVSISLLLEMAASGDPDRTALVSGDFRLTADELSTLADGGAGVIAASGAQHVAYVGTGGAMLPLLLFSAARAAVPRHAPELPALRRRPARPDRPAAQSAGHRRRRLPRRGRSTAIG